MTDLKTPGGRLQTAMRMLIRKFLEDVELNADMSAEQFDQEVADLADEMTERVDERLQELDDG